MSAQHIVLDLELWNDLRRGAEEAIRHYDAIGDENLNNEQRLKKVRARCRYALLDLLTREATIGTVKKMRVAAPRKRGPKSIWSDDNVLHAWLALEIQLLIARRKSNSGKVKVDPIFKAMFRERRGRPLRVADGRKGGRYIEIETAGTARRLHARGALLLKENPQLEARWRELAARGAVSKMRIGHNLPR